MTKTLLGYQPNFNRFFILVKNNFEYIDNSNNYLAQSLSYGSKPIYKIN